LAYLRRPFSHLKKKKWAEKEKSKASEESERVPSREQEKYRCSIFLKE
jgi:hypothetical protein